MEGEHGGPVCIREAQADSSVEIRSEVVTI
jgi:hypothetical protein